MLRFSILCGCALACGCSFLPEISHQPTLHNPFPQLSKVAVAPFINQSAEPTLNGDDVALAYFNELQAISGFEVAPPGVVKQQMLANGIELNGPEDARRLAQLLGVDAVVVGTVTDYKAYYPPRLGLRVLWYSANPCYHPIPPGYGLPWGTPEEEQIPGPLVYEAEMALARAQLETQTPEYEDGRSPRQIPAAGGPPPVGTQSVPEWDDPTWKEGTHALAYQAPVSEPAADGTPVAPVPGAPRADLPPDWPDPRGFIPPPPRAQPAACRPTDRPVLSHIEMFHGNDPEFTEALAAYYYFRDEARFGGWQDYLMRSDDFIRFCCHTHIAAMLSARGGAGQTRVVWRWPSVR